MPKRNPKVRENADLPGLRTFARPGSRAFRAYYAQQRRKDRKEARVSPLLLDTYPGAAAAYSLRSLSNSLAGSPVVRVRRSSDNAEQDFTATGITSGSLVSFCGSGDGLVTTWYDQSGDGNDATQTTAASQPKIVDAGALVTEGGKAALDFDGVDDGMVVPSAMNLTGLNGLSTFGVAAKTGGFRFFQKGDGLGIDSYAYFSSFDAFPLMTGSNFNTNDVGSVENDGLLKISSGTFTPNGDLRSYLNNTIIQDIQNAAPISANTDDLTIGFRKLSGGQGFFLGQILELIIYPSDQSTNRVGIETNINNHYGIF